MSVENKLDKIIDLLEELVSLQQRGNSKAKVKPVDTIELATPLTQEDYEALDSEIDPEWWFHKYGEEEHPAKMMNKAGFEFSKDELAYVTKSMKQLDGYEVNGGTHVFKFIGRQYYKPIRGTTNLYACVPNC
jgi:hypothetical protein